MSDLNQDPYAGANSDEEREAIYQQLLSQHEQLELERRKSIYSDLIGDWRYQRNIQQELDQKSHKYLFTLAAGSFGVSFAFINQIVRLESAENIPLLVISWAFFAATIILAILELKVGSAIQDILLNNVEKNLERGYKGEANLEQRRWLIMWPGRLFSWIYVFSFIIGVVCQLFFVLQNV